MGEVRHRSLPLYNRLKTLVKADDKRIWVFLQRVSFVRRHITFSEGPSTDTWSSENVVSREDGELPNDRNERRACVQSSYLPPTHFFQAFGRRHRGTSPIFPSHGLPSAVNPNPRCPLSFSLPMMSPIVRKLRKRVWTVYQVRLCSS